MIGVLGPTGQIGAPLMAALERGSVPVRALAHTPESAARITYAAADVMVGDVRDETTVAKFLDGVRHCSCSPSRPPTRPGCRTGSST